jgi:hypothetical protein
MAIEVFIVESSAPHVSAYSNPAGENRSLQTSRQAKVDSFRGARNPLRRTLEI